MSELARAAAGILAALAPFGALPAFLAFANRQGRASVARFALSSASIAFGILVVVALLAGSFLDLIDVSAENFQFAAGAIMAPLAVRLLLVGDSMEQPSTSKAPGETSWLIPVAFPLLAGPSAIAASITFSARYGEDIAIAGAALAVAVTAVVLALGDRLARALRPLGVNALGRLSGAFLVVVAVELAIDGVRSV